MKIRSSIKTEERLRMSLMCKYSGQEIQFIFNLSNNFLRILSDVNIW